MSVIVMGMEMPIACDDCKLRYRHQGAYVTDHCFYNMKIIDPWTFGRSRNGDKPDWCPLRPLPEKHGRLIDVDAFKTMCREAVRDIRDEAFLPQDIEKVRVLSEVTENLCLDLDDAPTIIEAED